ncbi:MAG: GIY-YIG nuclease family protein [Ignavibacteriae bacterium]|nr:GIY-YIG nuclease family protein [Ignavibacteriota bacterium]
MENIENKIQSLHYKRYTGIYLLYKNRKLIYVGVANDIYSRLTQHRISKKMWDDVKYIEEKDYYKAIKIENYLIDKYNPLLNKTISKLKYHESVNGKDVIYLKKNYPSGWS